MSFRILLIVFLLCACSCQVSNDSSTHKQIVEAYIAALNKGDYQKISSFLSDSLRTEEADFLLSDNLEAYHTHYQWDSVFMPYYEIVDMQEIDDKIQATLSKTCTRIRYLHDSALITKARIEFSGSKISRIQTYDFQNMNFQKWEARRDTLVAWIAVNHPDLNGFVFNQTIEGGQDYLKAMQLYINRTNLN